jgi:hypothetical protein
MKKTLVALAILAASGASFAQATITGNYTFGYVTQTAAGASPVAGLGTDTAAITVAASEDLGGGLKASAKVSLGGMMRDGAGTGEDASVTLAGGFGSVTFGTVESGNGLLAIGSSGASGFGLDGKVISGSSNIDIISFSAPLSTALKVGVTYVDRGVAVGTSTGIGAGTTGATGNQPSVGVSVTYGAGAVAAKADYTSWTRQNELDSTAAAMTLKSRVRLSAAYDMGAARLSAGYSNLERTTGVVATETLLGVAVPMRAVSLGLDYAMATTTGAADKSGFSLGASYALSKLTNVSASYYSWAASGAASNTGFRTFVSKSF